MSIFPSLIIGAAVLTAALALHKARRTAKRLERLTETYWDLRYEVSQLRARLKAVESSQPGARADQPGPRAATPAAPAFVPLSSLKR